MWGSLRTKLALAALLAFGLVGCGGNDDSVSPASLKSRLLPAADVPGFKIERQFTWDNPIDFVGQDFPLPESTPPSQAVKVLEDAGFEAGVGERLVVAKGNKFEGPSASIDVIQLGSDDEARDALEYIQKEAQKQPCFAVCSVEGKEFAVAGIPGAKGAQLTPLRQPTPDAPRPFEAYGVGFTIGPRLYFTNSGGPPGQVKKSRVLATATALYERNAKGNASSAHEPANGNARSGAGGLDRFLMRNGEEPGFRQGALPGQVPRSRDTITGVTAFVEDMRLAAADARRLRGEGFISFTAQPIRGPRGTAGITNVALFATAEGAKHNMARELRTEIRAFGPEANTRGFTVPGIPGARGWTASSPRVGNVWWVQGRCVLVLGNQGPGPFVGPLSTGARAIYERTAGHCP